MKDIAHEAFHHLQTIETQKRGHQTFSAPADGDLDDAIERFDNYSHKLNGDVFLKDLGYSVFDSSDYKSGRNFIKKERVSNFNPPSEAQARRIENRVQREYNLKNGLPANQGIIPEYNGWKFSNPLGVER